ncbi:MarR family winged helix-turn-helix transcriptional regulator [Streptomyces lavendulocolor]|uniref:MarR family winged helix-turn-helix transcriptional regulator n=1 Tax=Streptomyces lavendulocolor TaxID=67316 RepID=UPI003C2F2CF0
MNDARVGTPAGADRSAAAHAAREVIELLEVLWNKGRDLTSPAPVSSSQLRVLYILDRDRPINLRTLGDELGMAPSSVSRMCDRLDALGYVERSPSTASRRELDLRLSSRGRKYLEDLRARRETALVKVIDAMPPAQRAALATGLSGFRRAVEVSAGAEPDAAGESPAETA